MTFAIGIDLGGTNMRAALVSNGGEILDQQRTSTPVKEGPEATAQAMAHMIESLCKLAPSKIVGVGIGSPGPLSRKKKMIFQTPNLPGFDGFALGSRVEELCGHSVVLDNDAKCACFGEGLFGVARDINNYILLTFGTGIGGGVVSDGKMIYGKSDGACEIGHMTLHPDGLPCACGNRGCFEQYCSASAIKRRGSEKAGRERSVIDIFSAQMRGETWAHATLKEVSLDLAIATASLVNIFDPEMIVFGGGVFTEGGGPLISWVEEEIRGRCFASSQKGLRIESSKLIGNAGVLGAAALAFRHSMLMGSTSLTKRV